MPRSSNRFLLNEGRTFYAPEGPSPRNVFARPFDATADYQHLSPRVCHLGGSIERGLSPCFGSFSDPALIFEKKRR